jgi:hypothetical protein
MRNVGARPSMKSGISQDMSPHRPQDPRDGHRISLDTAYPSAAPGDRRVGHRANSLLDPAGLNPPAVLSIRDDIDRRDRPTGRRTHSSPQPGLGCSGPRTVTFGTDEPFADRVCELVGLWASGPCRGQQYSPGAGKSASQGNVANLDGLSKQRLKSLCRPV